MIFQDRQHAGQLLAQALKKYQNHPQAIVLGLPRGGVVLAYEVAQVLHLPLDIICARKIGAPFNPEYAIGAITDLGESFLDEGVIERLDIPPEYLTEERDRQRKEAERRVRTYRNHRPPLILEGKIAILIDDGIATGATMKAAIKSVKAKKAKKIVVAAPVASPDTLQEIEDGTTEVICLSSPRFFQAVGQFYEDFSQTTDDEVIQLLRQHV